MSKLLEQAIQSLRDLPEDEQDMAASALFAYISSDERHYHLTSDQIEAVRRTRRDLKTGKTRLASDTEVAAVRA
jgi:predicted metal-dependent HD superfamily phosphohydrolase